MNESPKPHVSRIHVEYDDGSSDFIELIQRGDFPLYRLTRKPDSQAHGAYTAGGIAALLFGTTISTKWTEYSSQNKKMAALIRSWLEETKDQK
jgi:hypothetical protein